MSPLPLFLHDRYLLRRTHRVLRGEITYEVCNPQGHVLATVRRPTWYWRTLSSLSASTILTLALMIYSMYLESQWRDTLAAPWSVIAMCGGFLLALIAGWGLYVVTVPKIQLHLFPPGEPHLSLLHVKQHHLSIRLFAKASVFDPQGTCLARISQPEHMEAEDEEGPPRHWNVRDTAGKVLYEVFEDDPLAARLRRMMPLPYVLFSYSNFVIREATGAHEAIAEFRRRETIHGMHVLDFATHIDNPIDRRIGLAIALLLDNY